jgi:catechol 2,3-dioxygenase-like lactoylglutathione lyase family enzyme
MHVNFHWHAARCEPSHGRSVDLIQMRMHQFKETDMLSDKEAVATVAVRDLKAAATFYEDALGLKKESSEGEEVITYRSGNSRLNVYRSQYAGTNKATVLTWTVGNELDAIVRSLKGNGVLFEHYDLPGLKLDGDVHVAAGMKVAWFKDLDGNIFSLIDR